MSAVLKQTMSLEAFLDWESRQEFKYEFDGFQPVAMTGGTAEHATIQVNLTRALGNRLGSGPCRVFGSELKIAVAGSIRYPDAFVICAPVPRGTTVVNQPVVVFEVLSASTSSTDRITKNREYRRTPSVMRYVILEQTSQAATVYARSGEDWNAEVLIGEAVLEMPEIGVSVPLPELYERIEFPPERERGVSG